MDTVLTLPPNVQVNNVARVFALLLGCKAHKVTPNDKFWHAEVSGVKVHSSGVPELVKIHIDPPYGECRRIKYYFEGEGGTRIIRMGGSEDNIALCRGVADFFGGTIDYNDCDDIETDYQVPPKSNLENSADDGPEYNALQARILKVKPLMQSLSPENSLWVAILLDDVEMLNRTAEEATASLVDRGFPPHVIAAYLRSRPSVKGDK